MDYWKSKVVPKMRLIFVKTGGKKAAAAAELVKSFDETKEGINGEFEEKKADLQPKVVEIYESVPAPVKILINERKKSSAIKKNSAAITKLFEDLAKIEFPGAKQVSEGIAKVGPALLSGPIFATFDKVSTLLPVEEQPPSKEEAPAANTEEKKDESAPAAAAEEKKEEAAAGEKKKEEEEAAEENKEEEVVTAAAAAAEEAAPPSTAEPAAEETSTATPAEAAAPEAAAPAEPESSAPAKAEETPKAAA